MTDSLLELHARALGLARVPALSGLDADTLLTLAEEADELAVPAGGTIGDPGAAYVLADRVLAPGETLRVDQACRALRLDADRWLDVVEELALP